MKLLKSKKEKVKEFMEGKDWLTVDEIALGCDFSKTKTKQALYQLKYKKLVENVDDKWKFSIPPLDEPEQLVEEPTSVDISNSSVAQSSPSEEVPMPLADDVPHSGLTSKIDDMQKQLNLVLGMKTKKEKKAKLKWFNLRKLKRYNKGKNRSVILMGNDQSLKLVKGEYFEGFKIIKVNKGYYPAGAVYTWLWGCKQPCYMIHESSLEPIASSAIYAAAKKSGNLIDPQMATIQAAKMIEQEKEGEEKKKMNVMVWVGIAIAGVIVAWLFFGGDKK